MIKINLALRKVAGGAPDVKTGFTKAFLKSGGGTKVNLQMDDLRQLPVSKILSVVILYFLGDQLLATTREEELAKVNAKLTKLEGERAKIQKDVGEIKRLELMKKNLEADEKLIRVKLETVEKLSSDRQQPARMIHALSSLTPPDVWLTSFGFSDRSVTLNGGARSLAQVTDYVRNLNESSFFSDVDPKAGTGKDPVMGDVAIFQFSARRR